MARATATLLLLACVAGVAHATVYAPMDDATLTAASAGVVTGTVTASASRRLADGRVVTETTVVVDRVFKGAVHGMHVTVTTPGGRVDDVDVVVYGAPSFAIDETVLLYLQHDAGGGARTTALALGAYRLTTSVAGTVIATEMAPTRQTRRLEDVAAAVQALGDPGSPVGGADTTDPVSAPFTLLGTPPGRWFEADSGTPVRLGMGNSDTTLGPLVSNGVVDAAMAAWTDVATASIVLQRGTASATGPSIASGTCDNRSVMQFNDPADEIGPLTNCAGVLAVGGFCTKTGGGTVNGQQFSRIGEGDLTVAKGLANCIGRTGFEEVVTHEIGHVIGIGHSSEDQSEPDPTLRDATMYFLAHLDGRGASIRADDVAAVTFIYPITDNPDDLDGDGIPNAADVCPNTPAGSHVDVDGCACGEAGHVACDDALTCTTDFCNATTGRCAASEIDCTGGDPCLSGNCDEVTGCSTTPLTGDAAVICVYRRAFPPSACLGEKVPRSLRKLFRKVARLVEKALQRDDVRLLQKADRKLARARKVIDRAANRKKRPQGPVCAAALGGLVDEARGRLPL
jgi:hypothetical protein